MELINNTIYFDDILYIRCNCLFVSKDTTTGIQALIIGFLVSQCGLPLVAGTIGLIDGINHKIKRI